MKTDDSAFVSVILLAAGESKRMGKPKLLLPFGNGTVVGSTVDNLLHSDADEVIVVLGANAAETAKAIAGRAVTIVKNPDSPGSLSRNTE